MQSSPENEKRVLKINPDLFSLSSANNTTRKRQPKNPNKIKVKSEEPKKRTDTLKKRSILNMIRKQQQEKYKRIFEESGKTKPPPKPDSSEAQPNSMFQEATQFLNHLSNKKKEDIKHNYTLKQLAPSLPTSVSTLSSIPSSLLPLDVEEVYQKPTPVPLPSSQWGCLKNGTLPTYRNFMNKTKSNQPAIHVGGASTQSMTRNELMESKINDSLHRVETAMKIKESLQTIAKPKIMKQKKTRKRTHNVGKSKIAPKIGVLVSNKTIRNNISTKTQQLKQTPLEEVKRFLVKHGMIKIGSIAPNDVLRKMYESATLMCGEVYNHNKDTLLHNFFHSENNAYEKTI